MTSMRKVARATTACFPALLMAFVGSLALLALPAVAAAKDDMPVEESNVLACKQHEPDALINLSKPFKKPKLGEATVSKNLSGARHCSGAKGAKCPFTVAVSVPKASNNLANANEFSVTFDSKAPIAKAQCATYRRKIIIYKVDGEARTKVFAQDAKGTWWKAPPPPSEGIDLGPGDHCCFVPNASHSGSCPGNSVDLDLGQKSALFRVEIEGHVGEKTSPVCVEAHLIGIPQ